MNPDEPRPLDCGHVNTIAGICQYEGCANKICERCEKSCNTCRRVLCSAHQKRAPGTSDAYCEDHIRNYLMRRLADRLSERS